MLSVLPIMTVAHVVRILEYVFKTRSTLCMVSAFWSNHIDAQIESKEFKTTVILENKLS